MKNYRAGLPAQAGSSPALGTKRALLSSLFIDMCLRFILIIRSLFNNLFHEYLFFHL